MKKILYLTLLSYGFVSMADKPVSKTIISRAADVYWAPSKKACAADAGNWIDESGKNCLPFVKTIGEPLAGQVCCVGATDDSMEEMGIA